MGDYPLLDGDNWVMRWGKTSSHNPKPHFLGIAAAKKRQMQRP